MAKRKGNLIGSWAFLIGVVIAVIFGAMGSSNETIIYALVVIGIIIGLLNVADEEAGPFLMSGAVLIIAAALGQGVVSAILILAQILDALLLLFVWATIVVAVKHVFNVAKK